MLFGASLFRHRNNLVAFREQRFQLNARLAAFDYVVPLGDCDRAVAQSGTSRENAEFLTNQATEKFPQSVDRSSILYSLSAQPSE
jgi:hypothetical protein